MPRPLPEYELHVLNTQPAGNCELVVNEDHFPRVVREGMAKAQVSLDILTADFKAMLVPSGRKGGKAKSVVELFRRLARQGVEIRILHAGTPSGPALSELKKISTEEGGKLTIRRCPRLHAKTVVIDTREMYLGSANLTNVFNGVFAVGRDLTNLNVAGSVSSSILAAGIWLGIDGVYNTSDDVIYGGSIVNAKINGVFTNSLLTAGVLPPLGVPAGLNNIPTSFNCYDYNSSANALAYIDGAGAGGIGVSMIQNVTFAKPVVSTSANSGAFSGLVAADGISKVNTAATTYYLKKIVRTDPAGAPTLPTAPSTETTSSLTFQSGIDGYSGSVDDHLPQNSTVSNTTGPILWVDANTSDGQGGQSLVRFENFIGDGAGQIPAGSTISSATLYLFTGTASSADAPGAGGTVHRMLQTWTNTYNWFSFGGDGVQADGIEAAITSSGSIGSPNGNVSGMIAVNVLTDVQAWINGAPNYGWVILPWSTGGTNGWAFYSDSYSDPSVHEMLSITYVPSASAPILVQPVATRVSTDEIRLTFDQPIDTSTISTATLKVTDTATGNPINDITFGYFRQTAPDGSTQGVVQIFSASHFGGAASLTIDVIGATSGTSLAGISSLRSSLLMYANDPFGVTVRSVQVVL